MLNKKTILLITNVQTKGNPALWFIYNCLKNNYNVLMYGSENKKKANVAGNINYTMHSKLYSLCLKLRIPLIFTCLFSFYLLFKPIDFRNFYHLINLRLRLLLNKLEFEYKCKEEIDFVINVDTEAAFITNDLIKKKKIPNFYFIYEFYAEQTLQKRNVYYEYKIKIENLAITACDIMLCGCNKILADFLLERYALQKEVVVFSVCADKNYADLEPVNSNPLSFYYHGGFFDNRGLQEAILAMNSIERAKLFLRGFGKYEKVLRETVLENNLQEKVIFLPKVPTEKLSQEAANYDIGLTLGRMNVLNHIYAIGFKTFENISASLALILPESYPLKKLNEDYHVGITYKDATVENLKEVFQYCVDNPEKVLEWKKNARIAYEKEYNPDVQKARLIQAIESLLTT